MELYSTFVDTQLPYVRDLDRVSTRTPRLKNVGCLYGRKGTGKSLLASTLAIANYLKGNVGSVYYYRYDPATKTFNRIFEIEGENGNQNVVIADDVHYFWSDLTDDILRGRITPLDRSIDVMIDINKLMNQGRSLLLYISDEHSLDGLRTIVRNVASITDWFELLELFFLTSKPCFEREVREDFFGTTYALLRGNRRIYNICNALLSLIEKEINTPTQNIVIGTPRMMRNIISELSHLDLNRPWVKLLEDPFLAYTIIRTGLEGSIGEVPKIITQEIIDEYDKMRQEFISILNSYLRNFERIRDWSIKKIGQISKMIKRLEILRLKSIREYEETLSRTDGNCREIIYWLERRLKYYSNLLRENVELLNNIRRDHESVIEMLNEKINKFNEVTSLMDYHQINLEIRTIYNIVKNKVLSTINENPKLFSLEDVTKLQDITSIKRMLEKVNKNAILLLKERHLLY
jgi:hypothetical protein